MIIKVVVVQDQNEVRFSFDSWADADEFLGTALETGDSGTIVTVYHMQED